MLGYDQSWIDAGHGREVARREDTRRKLWRELETRLLRGLGGAAAVGGFNVAAAFEILFGPGTLKKPSFQLILWEEVGNLEVFQVMLDIVQGHEIGSSSRDIVFDAEHRQSETVEFYEDAINLTFSSLNWVTTSIRGIYAALEQRGIRDLSGTDMALLNQCLVVAAASATDKGDYWVSFFSRR